MESVLNEEDKATLAYVRLLLALPFVAVSGCPTSARAGRALSGLILRLGTGLGLGAGGASFLGDAGAGATACAAAGSTVLNGDKGEGLTWLTGTGASARGCGLVTSSTVGDGVMSLSFLCQRDKHAPDRPLVRTSTPLLKNIAPDMCFR